MSARPRAFILALLLFVDALGAAIGVGAALHLDPRRHLGWAGDGGAVGVGVAIVGFVLLVAAAGLLLALLVATLRTPKTGPIAWRSTVIGVLAGFNFLLPLAIGAKDEVLLAALAVPSLLLLIAWRLPRPRHPALLVSAPIFLSALIFGGIALAGAIGEARDKRAGDDLDRIRAAIGTSSTSDVAALMTRLHWRGAAGNVDLECEALARQRLDTLDLLLARDPGRQDPIARLMRAIRAGDSPSLRAQLDKINALDLVASNALTPACLGDLMALSVCDARLDLAGAWTAALTLPEKELGELLLGLAGKKQLCVVAIENFLRRDRLMLPSDKIDPRLGELAIADLARALETDEPRYDQMPDTLFGAQLARWIVASELMPAAIRHNDRRLVEWTARHLPSLDAPDHCGTTPLAAAIVDDRDDTVSWLLAKGADANRAAHASCAEPPAPMMAPLLLALQKATTSATLQIVPALLAHHADRHVKGPTGESAAALAAKNGDDYLAHKIEAPVDAEMAPTTTRAPF